MTNIASIRLLLLLALMPLAGIAGFAMLPQPRPDDVLSGQQADMATRPLEAADIALLVERLGSTGLFPSSIPLNRPEADDNSAENENHGELINLEEELGAGAPSIRALFSENGYWRLLARFSDGQTETLEPGDIIHNGWRILAIGPNGIEIASDAEQRSINVFIDREI